MKTDPSLNPVHGPLVLLRMATFSQLEVEEGLLFGLYTFVTLNTCPGFHLFPDFLLSFL